MPNQDPQVRIRVPWRSIAVGTVTLVLTVLAVDQTRDALSSNHLVTESTAAVVFIALSALAWCGLLTSVIADYHAWRLAPIRAAQIDMLGSLNRLEGKLDDLAKRLDEHDSRVVPMVDLVNVLHEALGQLPGAVQVWGDSRLTDGILYAMERTRAASTPTNGNRPHLRSVDN